MDNLKLNKEQILIVDSLVAYLIMEYPSYDEDEIAAALKGEAPPLDEITGRPKQLPSVEELKHLQRPPMFCMDRQLTFSVLDRMLEDGSTADIRMAGAGCVCKFLSDAGNVLGQASSEHFGIAVCVAALRAFGCAI